MLVLFSLERFGIYQTKNCTFTSPISPHYYEKIQLLSDDTVGHLHAPNFTALYSVGSHGGCSTSRRKSTPIDENGYCFLSYLYINFRLTISCLIDFRDSFPLIFQITAIYPPETEVLCLRGVLT